MVDSNEQQTSAFLISAPAFRPQIAPASRPLSPLFTVPLSSSILEYWLNIIQKYNLEIIFGDPYWEIRISAAGTKNETNESSDECKMKRITECWVPFLTSSLYVPNSSPLCLLSSAAIQIRPYSYPVCMVGSLRLIMTVYPEMHELCVSYKVLSVA